MTNDRIKTRIAALRAKAQDSAATEAEALAAADMAAKLMDEHGLTLDDVTGDDAERPEVFEGIPLTGRWAMCHPFIADGVAKLCGVESYRRRYGSSRNPKAKAMWVGYPSDVELARYLYETINRAIMSESRRYTPPEDWRKSLASQRSDFAVCMADRIHDRLIEMAETRSTAAAETTTGRELVAVKDGAIAEVMASLNLKTARRRTTRLVDPDAAAAGREAAARVSLARPVTGPGAPRAIAAR